MTCLRKLHPVQSALRSRLSLFPVLLATLVSWHVTAQAAEFAIGNCAGAYAKCLDDWKAERLAFLKGENGYLNLSGLFWLKEGQNTFGGGAANDLVFPGVKTDTIGALTLRNGQVVMSVDSAHEVQVAGQNVSELLMRDDTMPDPVIASHGSLSWIIIRRDNQFALRLRDFDNPAIANFRPIDYYPTDETYRVEAIFHRYPEPRVIKVDTVIAGLDYKPWSPGVVEFELAGEHFDLEAYDGGDELFFVFGDKTSGRGTYPAGRFLYAKKPGLDGVLVLDFNTAQNPPCAFNDFATCPVASPRNRVPVPILAGEKYDPAAH